MPSRRGFLGDTAQRCAAFAALGVSHSLHLSSFPGPPAPPTNWKNVRDFGAKGDGATDDASAIQAAITSAQLGEVVYAPAGRYCVSRAVLATQHGIRLHFDGTLTPHGNYSGYLLELRGGLASRTEAYPGGVWQSKIDISSLTLDGAFQSRGLLCHGLDHFLMERLLIQRTKGTALRLSACREADFVNLTTVMCNGGGEPIINIENLTNIDACNNLRFFGLNGTYNAGTQLRLDSGARSGGPCRNISFWGAQLSYLDGPLPWGAASNDVVFIELLRTESVHFLASNLRLGTSSRGVLVRVGTKTRRAAHVNFIGCRISGDAAGATGLDIVNTDGPVGLVACSLLFPLGATISDLSSVALEGGTVDGGVNIGTSASRIRALGLAPLSREPVDRYTGMLVVADGLQWNPDAQKVGKPYPVFFDGTDWNKLI